MDRTPIRDGLIVRIHSQEVICVRSSRSNTHNCNKKTSRVCISKLNCKGSKLKIKTVTIRRVKTYGDHRRITFTS